MGIYLQIDGYVGRLVLWENFGPSEHATWPVIAPSVALEDALGSSSTSTPPLGGPDGALPIPEGWWLVVKLFNPPYNKN